MLDGLFSDTESSMEVLKEWTGPAKVDVLSSRGGLLMTQSGRLHVGSTSLAIRKLAKELFRLIIINIVDISYIVIIF